MSYCRVYNNKIEIDLNDTSATYCEYLTNILTTKEDEYTYQLFTVDEEKCKLVIGIGYIDYIELPLDYSDNRTSEWIVNNQTILTDNSNNVIANILSRELSEIYKDDTNPDISSSELKVKDITLRSDQVFSVMKMLLNHSGILQMSTGSGKTEVICAFLKYLYYKFNKYPTTIVLVPTVKLVNQTIDRMRSYGILAVPYRSTRSSISGVMVTHPSSVNNDLKKNPKHLSNLDVIICDEGHHLQADSWINLIRNSDKLEYRLALSASIIDNSHIKYTSLSGYSYQEQLVIGATGRLLVNYPPSYYISKGVLANPVVVRIDNPANEKIVYNRRASFSKYGDYINIQNSRIRNSKNRIIKLIECVKLFDSYSRKILILCDYKKLATTIFEELISSGLGNKVMMMFGGGSNHISINGLIEYSDTCSIEDFDTGKYSILIGTSTLYEGIDVPNLDVVMLYSVGKKQRVIIQTIGRVLRRTKTGRYAYIVDFTDHECRVLSKHSTERRSMYLDIIGVNPNLLYDKVTIDSLKVLFDSLEGTSIDNQ